MQVRLEATSINKFVWADFRWSGGGPKIWRCGTVRTKQAQYKKFPGCCGSKEYTL